MSAFTNASSQASAPITLKPGAYYFEFDGHQAFLFGRNPTGWKVAQFEPLLGWARESGERIARIHITVGMVPKGAPGKLDEAWARQWEQVFLLAASNGVQVLPVFDAWARWNDGSTGGAPAEWLQWKSNPHNRALGGSASHPGELLKDTECRKLWLAWAAQLVERWQALPNICAWEIFSELDLVTGANEAAALEFASQAAAVIRRADPRRRPVTASLSGMEEWPKLFASDALDIIQVHPYASDPRFKGQLDEMILGSVRARLKTYAKPVLIGESGLAAVLDAPSKQTRLVGSPAAQMGIRNAIWAAIVSGAMTGRMLWWEDGYDLYSKEDLRTPYRHAASSAAKFVADVDFSGFQPVEATLPGELFGGAIGNEKIVLGWFRDARCRAPDWAVRNITTQVVQLKLPGNNAEWRAEFYDTTDGKIMGARRVRTVSGLTTVPLPPFAGAVALKLVHLQNQSGSN
ncbi:MAG: hypothetical protein WCO56_27185 [Verrucomicrobiota bacterium]